jgi:hypothetical protein
MLKSAVFLMCLVALIVGVGECRATGLHLYLEHRYTDQNLNVTTPLEGEENIHNESFLQRYRLNAERRLSPTLTFRGGGLFELSDSQAETADGTTDAHRTRTSPYLNLTLKSYPFQAGVGFLRNEDRSRSNGTESDSLIRQQYHGSFGWQPEDGLPSLNLRYELTDNYDEQRVQLDTSTERWQFGSNYQVTPELLLRYQANLDRTENHRDQVQNDRLNQRARIDYNERFFGGRTAFSGSYTLGLQHTRTVASGQGEVESPPFFPPITGLYSLDDSPLDGLLGDSPAVNDNDRVTSAGITLVRAAGELTVLRNVGLEFPNTVDTRLNTLRAWVLPGSELQDPPFGASLQALATAFKSQVLTSRDGITWSPSPVTSVAFDPFQPFFEVRFPTVSARFVKLVVAPLEPGALLALAFPDLQLAELEGTLFLPAAEIAGSAETTSHNLSLNARTQLLDHPSLAHTLSIFYATSQPGGSAKTSISNVLSLLHRFTPKLTGSAQASRDDYLAETGNEVEYRWGSSLMVTPLPTLLHSLSYSGSYGEGPEGTHQRESLYLTNRLALYQGLNVLLNAGGSLSDNEEDQHTESYQAQLGVTVTPHPSMTFDLSLSYDESDTSGGGKPPASRTNNRERGSIAWNPVAALSLYLAYERVDQGEQGIRTLHNYSANWSPFRGGALLFQTSFNETLQPYSNLVDRTLTPSIIWKIRNGTNLTLSYSDFSSDSPEEHLTGQSFNANLLMGL